MNCSGNRSYRSSVPRRGDVFGWTVLISGVFTQLEQGTHTFFSSEAVYNSNSFRSQECISPDRRAVRQTFWTSRLQKTPFQRGYCTGVKINTDMVCKNWSIYGFLGPSWVLITAYNICPPHDTAKKYPSLIPSNFSQK